MVPGAAVKKRAKVATSRGGCHTVSRVEDAKPTKSKRAPHSQHRKAERAEIVRSAGRQSAQPVTTAGGAKHAEAACKELLDVGSKRAVQAEHGIRPMMWLDMDTSKGCVDIKRSKATAAKPVTIESRSARSKVKVGKAVGQAPPKPAEATRGGKSRSNKVKSSGANGMGKPSKSLEAVSHPRTGPVGEPELAQQVARPEIVLREDYRPSEAEPFMNELQLHYFKRKLTRWKEDVLSQTRRTLNDMHQDSMQFADLADRATSEADRALELRARDRQRKLISKIDAALARIEDGSYGYCEETGEPIGLKRLDARPIATLSLEAQERHERRERVHRED